MVSIKDIIKGIEELPTPDFVLQRIIKIASDPDSSTKDLQSAVMLSQSLTAKLLKLVNSAYYALPRRVTKISKAINILGFKTVRNLALSAFVAESFFRKEYEYIDVKNFWKHLMAVAIASEILAQFVNYPEKEDIFLCGMLHDFGKIVMEIVMPNVFEIVLTLAKRKKLSFYEAEKKLNVISHQIIGKMIFETWNLPENIMYASEFHNSPKDLNIDTMTIPVYIVHLADVTINTIYYGYSGSFNIPYPDPDVWNKLGLNTRKYMNYFNKLKDVLSQSRDFLDISSFIEEGEEENES